MKAHRGVALIWGLCTSVLLGTARAHGDDMAKSKNEKAAMTIKLGSLRITNRLVEMRCEIRNNTGRDIWVCDGIPHQYDHNRVRGTNAEVYIDKEGQTLLILRRIDLPLHGSTTAPVAGTYARLHAGESQPYVFLVVLPIAVESPGLQGFHEAIHRGTEYLSGLAFQIGYYTSEDLRSLQAVAGPFGRIHIESGDRVQIYEDPPWITYRERAATIRMEGVCIPYRQWINIKEESPLRSFDERANRVFDRYLQLSRKLRDVFGENLFTSPLPPEEFRYADRLFRFDPNLYDDPTRRVADIFILLVERKLPPSELTQHLDAILGRPDREKLIDELFRKEVLAGAPKPTSLTTAEALRDLFDSFSLDVEQYQYAQKLLEIDRSLYDDSAKRIADVYVQVAQGTLRPAELRRSLDGILSQADREKLLRSLQREQFAPPPKE